MAALNDWRIMAPATRAVGWIVHTGRAGLLLLVLLTAAGCGNGSVTAEGKLLVEGQAFGGGRLSLSPLGGGDRAFGAVAPDGTFALNNAQTHGAMPGKYGVVFRHKVDQNSKQKLEELLGNPIPGKEPTLIFRSPRGEEFAIPETGVNDMQINVAISEGWSCSLDD